MSGFGLYVCKCRQTHTHRKEGRKKDREEKKVLS